MTTLKVSSWRQITLNKDLRRHLGIENGGEIEFIPGPNRSYILRAVKPNVNPDNSAKEPVKRTPQAAKLKK